MKGCGSTHLGVLVVLGVLRTLGVLIYLWLR